MTQFMLGLVLFGTGGVASLFVSHRWKGPVFAVFAAAAQFFLLPLYWHVLSTGTGFAAQVALSYPFGAVWLRIDPLAAFFALIIALGGLLAALYSAGYMKLYERRRYSQSSYYVFMGGLITAMSLVVTVQNAPAFIVVWELMSLFSFFLVNFEHDKEQVSRAALYYLIAMQVGAAFLIVAFSWSFLIAGNTDFESFRSILGGRSLVSLMLLVSFLIGFSFKAGLVPFHTWLPLAHPAAPTGVSAVMSGVMIKTGIYGILRILLLSGAPPVPLAYTFFFAAALTGLFGIMNAAAQSDMKKLLAYSSMENIGIIGMGIGMGMLGLAYGSAPLTVIGLGGGLLHVFNHFSFKSLLFYGAGSVYFHTHTRNIEKMGGLGRSLPVTAALFLLGSLAICGLPPFNGFISEFLLYLGMLQGVLADNAALDVALMIGVFSLSFIGVMAVLVFTRAFSMIFLGKQRTPILTSSVSEQPLLALPSMISALFIVGIGVAAAAVLPLLHRVVAQFLPNETETLVAVSASLQPVMRAFWILCALIAGLLLFRFLLLHRRNVSTFKTWDCGWQTDSGRLQYTASSYSSSFLRLVGVLVPQKRRLDQPDALFPQKASFETTAQDLVEQTAVQPLTRAIDAFLGLFAWIQSGRTQQYILYGLIFLVILVIWIIGVR